MSFLYFAPGRQKVTSDDLDSYGLSRSVVHLQPRECRRGPNSESGCIFAERRQNYVVRMDCESQVWQECPGDLWIGWDKGCRPGPNDLARSNQLEGETVSMADGSAWVVPVLRHWRPGDPPGPPLIHSVEVPRTLSRGADGWVEGDVIDEYREIWERSTKAIETFFGSLGAANRLAMETDELIDFAADLISVNYRVGVHEVSALGLLTFPIARNIVRIGIGAASLEEAMGNVTGRSSHGTPSSNSGAERPTTDAEISTPIDPPAAS